MKKRLSQKLLVLSFLITASLSSIAQSVSYTNKNALPEIGVVASDAISLDKEMIVGDAVMRQMRGQSPLIADPVLDEYLQDLGNRLVIHAENAKFPFRFFWVDNDAINAFAFFGGHIGVHTGLMRRANTESELASVLAHEISHVTQRHIARSMQAQQRSSPLAIASLIGGVLIAMANPQAGMAAMQAGQAASVQMQIDYTRSNEQEADRIGIAMLSRAGFDANGAADFFSIMAEEYRNVSRPPARLLTHPLTESRIADARSRADDYPSRFVPVSKQFELAKARIMARYSFEPDYAVEYFTAQLDKEVYRVKEASLYALALAYMRTEEYDKAQDIVMGELLRKDSGNLFYLDAATDIYIAKGEPLKAVEMLSPFVENSPRNQVLALNQANAMISASRYDDAISLLKDFLLVNDEYQIAHQLMSEAYQKAKRFSQMHQSKAEVYALYGAYTRAVDELQYAYNFAKDDDHLQKQRIRARIKQFRDQEERLQRL
ncbi:M48 family metalloprotease [Alteromonas sp. CI.11.F.A3]|uniref:beta-barrel assembly-enhancing protease n=1 Tax=unclassified Alteromonas TaxID=2614992 RepID=UPI001B3A1044|nr:MULTISPECIES: M48 family metalloprotease [unclassified Alteromonas]MBQ4829969.1 M48 family metallopeptidase [Alteromonas sp. MMG017]WOI35838.1 M48 family metalloprotease [Alteromonas sp. CI.11.F.A3]